MSYLLPNRSMAYMHDTNKESQNRLREIVIPNLVFVSQIYVLAGIMR